MKRRASSSRPRGLSRPFVPPRAAVGERASEGADNAEQSRVLDDEGAHSAAPGGGVAAAPEDVGRVVGVENAAAAVRAAAVENAATAEAEAAGAPEEVRGPTGWMPQREKIFSFHGDGRRENHKKK